MPADRLATSLCGIQFRNPVLAASGTFGYGLEFASLLDLNELGGIVTKGLSREPIAGNAPPRLWPTEAGMINSVGLQNVGVRAFVREKLPKLKQYSVPVIANVFGYKPEDYLEVIRVLEDTEGIAGYELNVSCPNTDEGGIFFSSDPRLLADVVARVRSTAMRALWVKLSPNVARIEPLARAAEDAGADAISLVNTFVGLAADVETHTSRIGNGFGGLSGPAIRPIASRMVREASQAVKIPLIGMGGITNGASAAEFLLAGATAVEVGTATFIDPRAPVLISRQLDALLAAHGISHVSALIGALHLRAATAPAACPSVSAQ
ncbi:MAG: dihydroorotate dehydrogenase [Acidobacteriaceae bacterium]|nr:dihydroorotate dehydrogenase [Acidobacteriaceae bacterium]